MGLGAGQNALNGLLGVGVDSGTITESLIVGGNQVFNTGATGGLQGMFGHGLQAFANITGFPDAGLMLGLETGLQGFNTQLVDGLTDFNQFLDAGQQGFLGLLGADFDPTAMTSSLLATSGFDGVFSDGAIGGLQGVLGNSYMVLANLLGLFDPTAMFGNLDLFGMVNPMTILDPMVILSALL